MRAEREMRRDNDRSALMARLPPFFLVFRCSERRVLAAAERPRSANRTDRQGPPSLHFMLHIYIYIYIYTFVLAFLQPWEWGPCLWCRRGQCRAPVGEHKEEYVPWCVLNNEDGWLEGWMDIVGLANVCSSCYVVLLCVASF